MEAEGERHLLRETGARPVKFRGRQTDGSRESKLGIDRKLEIEGPRNRVRQKNRQSERKTDGNSENQNQKNSGRETKERERNTDTSRSRIIKSESAKNTNQRNKEFQR